MMAVKGSPCVDKAMGFSQGKGIPSARRNVLIGRTVIAGVRVAAYTSRQVFKDRRPFGALLGWDQ